MDRNLLVLVIAIWGCFATPNTADAQPERMYRIGFLSPASTSSMAARLDAFRQGLRERGYVEGQNITIEYRWGEGKDERLTDLAAELIQVKVSLVVSHGVLATQAVRKASNTLPIVCFGCGDVLATGLATSLARPGGNITGQTVIAPEVSGKRLQLLREVVPRLTRVAVLWNSSNPVSQPELSQTEAAARLLGLQLQSIGVRDADGFESAFSAMRKERADALIVLSDAMLFGQRKKIAELALRQRLPALGWTGEFARAGGIVGFGPDLVAIARSAAGYVDKILNGAKAADLPIEQPTKFEIVVNLKTARSLGLTIPQSVVLQATDVVQ